MNLNFWRNNTSLRYATVVFVAGAIATILSWYSYRQWTNYLSESTSFEQLTDRLEKGYGRAKAVLSSGDKAIVSLEKIQSEIETIYNGASALPATDDVTRMLLQKGIVDLNTLIEAVEQNQITDNSHEYVLVAGSSLDSILIHYREMIKSTGSKAIAVSLISLFILVVLTVGATGFVYKFFRKVFGAHNELDRKHKEEESRVEKLTQFIEAMSTGNYNIKLSDDKNDELSTSLVAMRDKLLKTAEEDKRRNWATTGLAKIGDILRSNKSSAELYDNIISFVVKYTNSNQGGLFVQDEDNGDALDLVACYAFERKKFLTKKVEVTQGLVGQCFLEKERVYMTNVPSEYINITSGLGGDNPCACLLVPLKVNDQVYGVIELASFKPYQEFEIELVESFAESIASTISSVRINESTKMLLERTQQQAEEMKSQEEEMRQNMEELSATQEEMQRKEQEYIQRIQELEEQLMSAEQQ